MKPSLANDMTNYPENHPMLGVTRRHFFSQCAMGVGSIALASMLNGQKLFAGEPKLVNPLAPKQPHFPAKAKNIIYLFMAGGPSQLEMFDYKPKLIELNAQPIPESFVKGKRFAFMDSFSKNRPQLLGTRRKFAQHGQNGAWVSELMPHTATIVDDITIVKSCATDVFNHAPAKLFMNTGSTQFGRPSFGSWTTYGLGSESQDLPGFVVLQSGPRGPRGGSANWSSGFLPTTHQGVPLRGRGDPILDLSNPHGVTASKQREAIDAIRDLNLQHLVETGDPEIETRISAYEMAYRMQTSGPDLIDLSTEKPETLEMYGIEKGQPSFANNCLLARRLVERGVRFIQLYHTSWDSHGGPGEDLDKSFDKLCLQIDKACAALIKDLKQRGLLDETLVVWGGEFGRTPMGENRETTGRNHHIDAFTMWMAGGGVPKGKIIGETDELGFNPVEDRVHVHDLHATLMHLMGLDHKRLTFKFQGRDFRLTDVHGELVKKLIA